MVLLGSALLAVRQVSDAAELASDSRAPTLYGVMGSFGSLALIAVVLRFYTRIRFAKLGWDDVLIAIGLILYTGLIVATVSGMYIWEDVHGSRPRLTSALADSDPLRLWDARLVFPF
jgi:hypothetical protein